MKFEIFLIAVALLGVRAVTDYKELESLSVKDQFRVYFKDILKESVSHDVDELCGWHWLSAEQTVFGNQKLIEFSACGNATIDKFVDKLDFDSSLSDISSPKTVRKYIGPVCQVFDDIFKCVSGVEPLIDLCISGDEKRFKERLFTIVPLLQQTFCLKNGDLLADLLEHDDGPRCAEQTYEWLSDIAFDEIFNDGDIVEFFGSEPLCREFNRLRLEMYRKVGECSSGVLDIVSEVLGYFCEETKCHRFISDLECF